MILMVMIITMVMVMMVMTVMTRMVMRMVMMMVMMTPGMSDRCPAGLRCGSHHPSRSSSASPGGINHPLSLYAISH